MATKKITETKLGSTPSISTNFLVTQPETGENGEEQESLRRIQVEKVVALLKQLGQFAGLEEIKQMSLVENVEQTETGLKVTWVNGQEEEFTVASKGGGQSFDGGYQDEDGFLHLTKDGEDIEGFDPFKVAGGSGGSTGGSKITFACYTSPTFSVMESSAAAVIRFKFLSIDTETGMETGSGNLAISVGGVVKANVTIQQGDNLTVDVFKYLSTGSNAVKLTITDGYGSTASRNFTVTVENFTLEWSLKDTNKNTEDVLSFYITPTGSGSKTIYTYVDDALYATDTVNTSGRRLTKTISGLEHGAHTIEVYGTMDAGGAALESNHLRAAVAQIKSSSQPIVAVRWPSGELAQYTTVQIPFMVVDPTNNPAEVQLIVNGIVQSSEKYDQSEQVWSYRPATAGNVTLAVKCGTVTAQKTVVVTGIGTDVEEVTDGMEIKMDPSEMTNLAGWKYGDYGISLSANFDLVNGGLQVDEDGVHCIRITAGDRLTLNYPLFTGDARKTGKSAKIIYKVQDSSNKEAEVIRCMSQGIGFLAKANNAYLSGNQTTIKMSLCEDEKTELDINIQQDAEDRLLYMWEGCSTFSYNQYAANESFTHTDNIGITFGSDDADVFIYLFRAYGRDLTDNEIRANYIHDGSTGAEILSRKERNDIYDGSGKIDVEGAAAKNPNVHFITVNAERMTIGKKDTVTGSINHVCVAGGNEHKWTAPMEMVVQGTSSVEHAETAGGNLKFRLKKGITLEDGTHKDGYAMHGEENSIPISILNFKKNIASEDHIVNMMCAEWYHKYQPSIRQERIDDPRVRDCLEAVMCAVFFHNTGSTAVKVGPDIVQPDETVFFGLGNLCTDKDAENAFQYEPIVIEVKNNTEPQVRFKSDDLTGANFDNNFEFRYLDTDKYTEEQAKALWQKVQTFVCACDFTQATNTALPNDVSINGQLFQTDTAEYRKAKWKAEAADHFDMAGLYWHHNDTLFHLLRDNRAKNMFYSYRPDTGKWSLKFNWDNDTGHCRNNEGYVDIEPGYLDYDTIGTAYVFNAADNVIFQNLRECNFAELQAAYIERESAGAWNIDTLYQYAKENQNYICESLWIEDAQHNAIRTMQNLGTTAYLERATGKLQLHLKKSLTFQKALVDSYYCASASIGDSASFRGYTPTEWSGVKPSGLVTITPYTDMFINILAGSTAYRERAYAGKPVEIDVSAALNDTEIYLRNAGWIMEIGNLAGLYLGQVEASKLKRVRVLLIGSDADGYRNTNFTTASFDNCKKLEVLNMGGLVNAKKAFDFGPNIYLRKLYTKGSGITGITFAQNGRVKEVHLNGVASLVMKGLRMLQTFDMESYSSLASLIVEDSPAVDSYELTKSAANLTRVRLLDIDWKVPTAAYEVLMRLHKAHGIDDDGYDTDYGTLTGAVYFSSISASRYENIVKAIPEITFTYGDYLEEFTVKFQNYDGTEYPDATQKVEVGGKATDPVAAGMIKTPTKAPSIDYTYEFYGWDMSLDYIIKDTTFTAVYLEIPRVNTVVFKDYTGEILQTDEVPARGSTRYRGDDLVRDGYIWTGWDKSTDNVIDDMVVTATYEYPTLPAEVKDLSQYDFAYSDDPNDNAAYSFGELYTICKTGQARRYLPLSSRIKIIPVDSTIVKDTSIVMSLHSYGHYEIVETGKMSNADWYMVGVLNSTRQMNPTNTNAGGWDASKLRDWLNGEFFRSLHPKWRQFAEKTKVYANKGDMSADITISEDFVKIPSYCEIGFGVQDIPYKNECSGKENEVTFACYTNNTSRIKKTFNNEGTAQNYWTRSAWAGGASAFATIYNYGGGNISYNASTSLGVCAGLSS